MGKMKPFFFALFLSCSSLSLTFAKVDQESGTYNKCIALQLQLLDLHFSLKIGINVIESVFDICDQKDSDERLTLVEMKEIDCSNFLANIFGMLHEHIDKEFEAIDKNGDGLVSKEETRRRVEDNGLCGKCQVR